MSTDLNQKFDLSRFNASHWLKFIFLSAFGLGAFIINFTIPSYTVMNFTQAEAHTLLISHISNIIRALFWNGDLKLLGFVVWFFGFYALYDMYFKNKQKVWGTSTVNKVFGVFKTLGFICVSVTLLFFYTNHFGNQGFVMPGFEWYFAPQEFIPMPIALFVLNRIVIMVTVTIPIAAAFLPFVVGYGLVDFAGVFMRLVMRPLFNLPGRAAVISVTALLATFVVAFLGGVSEYKSGKMTEKESLIIMYGLSSASIGFLIVIGNNTGINVNHWNLYLWTSFLFTLLVTIVCVRIPPLRTLPNTFADGIEPNPEGEYKSDFMKHAISEALEVSKNAIPFHKRFVQVMKDMVMVLSNCATGSTFFAGLGLVLYIYTPIISVLSWVFYPLGIIFLPAEEASVLGSAAWLSFIEITLPSLLVLGGEWSLRLRYILSVIPISSIVFIAAWVPTILAMPMNIKFSHICITWFQRMVLSILFAGALAMVIFSTAPVAV